MSITLDGTNGITTPDLESTGPVTGTTGTFSGAVSGTTGTFSDAVSGTTGTFSGAVSGTTGTFSGLIQAAAAGVRFNDTTVQTTAATAPTTATVLTAIAGGTAGAVGTYMYCLHSTANTMFAVNATYAGSVLRQFGSVTYIGTGCGCVGYNGFWNAAAGSALAGTWRSVSVASRPSASTGYAVGLLFRIS